MANCAHFRTHGIIRGLMRLKNAFGDITFWVDCSYVVKAFAKGQHFKHRKHGRFWRVLWMLIADHPDARFKVLKVWRSHVEPSDIACGFISPFHAAGNAFVDKLARAGADEHQISEDQSEWINRLDAKAWII